jgi:hypothetical protein
MLLDDAAGANGEADEAVRAEAPGNADQPVEEARARCLFGRDVEGQAGENQRACGRIEEDPLLSG